jgi:hypothetical protein
MIQLIGPEDTPEYRAACQLRQLVAEEWPDVAEESNTDDRIRIVAAAKCFGQRTVDIDLVVYVQLAKLRLATENSEAHPPIYIRSLCLTIELKEHEPDGIQVDGNQVRVCYGKRMHSATEQTFNQQVSLRKFIEGLGYRAPFVTAMLWLPNVPEDKLPEASHNIIGAHATWRDILHRVVSLKQPIPHPLTDIRGAELDSFRRCDRKNVEATIGLLTKKLETSPLDRKKIEMLSKRRILDSGTKYIQNLGQQLLVFRGRGGLGRLCIYCVSHESYTANVMRACYCLPITKHLRRTLGGFLP